MKCASSSYVLTAQPVSGGGLSLSGNSRNVVKTGAMAFVFHGKKLEKDWCLASTNYTSH